MADRRRTPPDDAADRGVMFTAPMVRALLDARKTQTRRLPSEPIPAAPAQDNVHPARRAMHPAPYLDAYCGRPRTVANPRGMSPWWCWWTRDDRPGPQVHLGFAPGQRLWVKERHALTRRTLDPETGGEEDHFAWTTEYGDPRPHLGGDPRFGLCAALHYEADGEDANPSVLYPSTSMREPSRVLRRAEIRWRSPRCMWRWASRLTLAVTDVRLQRLHDIDEADALAEGVVPVAGFGYAPTADGLVRRPDGTFEPLDKDLLPHMVPTARGAYALLWDRIHGAGAWAANPWVTALSFGVDGRTLDVAEAEAASA